MHGEISKRPFNEEEERKHYQSVNMQMGRVQLDSDWNEAFEILLKSRSRSLTDIIGIHGSPNNGFRVEHDLILDHFDFSKGWIFNGPGSWRMDHLEKVEGFGSFMISGNGELKRAVPSLLVNLKTLRQILEDRDATVVGTPRLLLHYKVSATENASIQLEISKQGGLDPIATNPAATYPPNGWQVIELDLATVDLTDYQILSIRVATTGSVHLDRLALAPGLAADTAPDDFYIQGGEGTTDNAGRYYVEGHVAVKEGFETYQTQQDYPEPPAINLAEGNLAYLDVWKRTITAVEDPDILEVALDGPDTCTREQLVAQVKVLPAMGCMAGIEKLLRSDGTGNLTTGLSPDVAQGECDFKPEMDYTGLENALYRIEIHEGGNSSVATFKWSRNNGAVLVAVTGFDADTKSVIVPSDRFLCHGDWVEICDDVSDLADFADTGQHGKLAKIVGIFPQNNGVKITLENSTKTFSTSPFNQRADRYPKLRKWDGVEDVHEFLAFDTTGVPTTELEHGIRLAFSGDHFYPGDFWQFTARVNTRAIEALDHAPPTGPQHHYAPLAVVNTDLPGIHFYDCRKGFPALTDLHAVRIGVHSNFCIERPKGPADGNPVPPVNVQQALDNICGYINNLYARDIGFEDTTCTMGVSNVQDAIDHICRIKERGNCCTVTVGDGVHSLGQFRRLQEAIDSLPAHFGGKICLGAGQFDLEVPVIINNKQNIQITGLGSATLLRIQGYESAIEIQYSKNIQISNLKIKAAYARERIDPEHRNGVISVTDTDHIQIRGCTLSTPALKDREQACLTIRTSRTNEEGRCRDIQVQDNVFIPGDRQIGVLILNGHDVTVTGNRIHRDRGYTYQGIVIGGRTCTNVRIADNTMRRVFQGVHVGVSHRTIPPASIQPKRLKRVRQPFFYQSAQVDKADQVRIHRNTVEVLLPDFYKRERHGIFVGNCEALSITDNYVNVECGVRTTRVDGIRVYGHIGPLATIRDNHIRGIGGSTGGYAIYFSVINPADVREQHGIVKWLIADNMTYCTDPRIPRIFVDSQSKEYVTLVRNC